MLHTMLITDVVAPQIKDEANYWDNRTFTSIWPGMEAQKTDLTKNRTIKKKGKRVRTAFTTDQLKALEKTFSKNKYINSENRRELSKQLKINDKCIKIWFQNKRMKEKREASESSESSSETFSRDSMSPPNLDSDTLKPKTDNIYPSHQYTNYAQYSYQQPMLHSYNLVNQQSQVYEQLDNVFTNDFNNSMTFCNETNAYPTQYYPSGETGPYHHQNQYQVNDIFNNWCTNNVDFYNFYQ